MSISKNCFPKLYPFDLVFRRSLLEGLLRDLTATTILAPRSHLSPKQGDLHVEVISFSSDQPDFALEVWARDTLEDFDAVTGEVTKLYSISAMIVAQKFGYSETGAQWGRSLAVLFRVIIILNRE